MYEAARARIAEYIGAEAREEVVFTAGATASLNTVAYAWCERFLRAGDNIVVSEMEHHSNIVPWQLVAERKGAEIRVLPFDEEGRLMTERLPALLDARTRVVAVTQASNTLGTRPDLRPVIDEAHRVGAVVVVDGCQGVVHGGVDVKALDCDFTPSPVINSMPRRVSACCTASGICLTGCPVSLRRRHGRSGVVRKDDFCTCPVEIRSGYGQFRGGDRAGRSGALCPAVRCGGGRGA